MKLRRNVPNVEGAITRVAQHLVGGATPQQVGVVDAVATHQHRVDQGQQLATGPMRAGPLAQVDHLIGGLGDAQPLGQRGSQQQPRIGHRVGVIKGDVELVWVWEDRIEKVPF